MLQLVCALETGRVGGRSRVFTADAGLIGVEDWALAGELNRLRLEFRHEASCLRCSIHPRYERPKP